MNYKKWDSFAEKRGTYIALSIFLFFALCFNFAMDARGYFFRMWNGTKIQISNVEMTLPKGYYIDSKEKGEYVICDIDANRVQLYIEAWTGSPEISKMTEEVKAIGGEVRSYENERHLVYEFFYRTDSWREDLGVISFIFPVQHVRITYFGSLSMMYNTLKKFTRRLSQNNCNILS